MREFFVPDEKGDLKPNDDFSPEKHENTFRGPDSEALERPAMCAKAYADAKVVITLPED